MPRPAPARADARGADGNLAVDTSDPQTVAFALEDSPAGLTAWIAER